MKSEKIWVVAAGTGGHIFPGLSIVKEWQKKNPSTDFVFFGTKHRLETKIIPAHGFKVKLLHAGAWKGKDVASRLRGLLSMTFGFSEAFSEGITQRPHGLISIGGYVAMPVGLAAFILRIPIFLVEPNICAGFTQKILSRFARLAFATPSSNALKVFKCKTLDTGNPCRENLERTPIKNQVKKILIFGGSQGAQALCISAPLLIKNLKLAEQNIELILQSGENNFSSALASKEEFHLGPEFKIFPFIDNVSQLLADVDVVIARAGAGTVTELSLASLPTIFVPFPHAADDHQKVNAKLLQDAGAALMVEEGENFQIFLEKAVNSLCFDSQNFEKRQELSNEFYKWARPAATQNIVKHIQDSLVDK